MTARGPVDPDDLALVADTDALLDALAAGRPHARSIDGEVDASTDLLSAWRIELDEHATTTMTTAPTVPVSGSRYWVRTHRKTAAATALVVALAGSTGVAAAASGPTGPLGPLHKLFFGDNESTHRLDPLAAAADRLLDSAQQEIEAAKTDGSIDAATRARLAAELDEADAYLQRDALAPAGLNARLNHLRTELARIPLAVEDGATPGVDDQRDHGSDDTEGHDGDIRGGQGENQGGDEGRGEGDQSGDESDGQGEDQGGTRQGEDQGSSDSDDGSSGSHDGDSSADYTSTPSGGDNGDDDSSGSRDGGDDEGTNSIRVDHDGSSGDDESASGASD